MALFRTEAFGDPPYLVVEEMTDYYALRHVKDRNPTTRSISIIPASGVEGTDPIVSLLLARGEKFVLLLDDDQPGRTAAKRYREEWFLGPETVQTLGDLDPAFSGKKLEGLISSETKKLIAQRIGRASGPTKKEIRLYLAAGGSGEIVLSAETESNLVLALKAVEQKLRCTSDHPTHSFGTPDRAALDESRQRKPLHIGLRKIQRWALGDSLDSYVKFNHKRVSGWFSRINAEIFATILKSQSQRGVTGGLVEIGIHHGRSFILLSLAAQHNEKALAIDVFNRQDLNLDQSGKGNLTKFRRNLSRFGKSECVEILAASSLGLKPGQILCHTGPVRFFSIDGGHSFAVTLNDLELAAATVNSHGVIAIDDFGNADWPEVCAAFYHWWRTAKEQFAPFAIARGKLYICRRGNQGEYREALHRNPYLRRNYKKEGTLLGDPISIVTGLHGGWLSPVKKFIEIHHPNLWRRLKAFRNRGRAQ